MMTYIRKMLRTRFAAIAALLALTVATGACGDTAGPEEDAAVEDVQEQLDDADVFERRQDLVGQDVTVSAEVSETFGPRSFLLAGDEFGTEALLVVGADEFDVSEGDVVKVTGTVREFEIEALEEDLGVDFDAGVDEFEGEPIIVADSVDKTVPEEDES